MLCDEVSGQIGQQHDESDSSRTHSLPEVLVEYTDKWLPVLILSACYAILAWQSRKQPIADGRHPAGAREVGVKHLLGCLFINGGIDAK